MNKIITIFGGTGFLGRYVVKHLAAAGYRLRVVSRRPEAAKDLIVSGSVGQISLIAGDIKKPQTYAAAIRDAHAVINLVGILFESGKQKFTDIHSLGAEKLAVAAKAAGAERFIQISALGVEHEFGSVYARSKLLGERAVLSAFPEATILRPSVIFGAEDGFINKFAKMACLSPFLPLIGGGKTLFQPVYVDDVAKAITACLANENSKGQIYELGGTQVYSFKQILEYIVKHIGKKRYFVSQPFSIASIVGGITEHFPNPILTRDQVKLLKYNNTVNSGAKNFSDLGITPVPLAVIAPGYLAMYRKKQPL